MKAKRPLNPKAVKIANEKLWKDNPELKGRKLTMAKTEKEYGYRNQWMKAYQQALKDLKEKPPTSGDDGKVGAPAKPCPAPTTANLAVTVTHTRDGSAVPGARVEISGPTNRKDTTGEKGKVEFTGVNPGSYSITGSKANYKGGMTTATVTAGTTTPAALTLTADVELGITVMDKVTKKKIQGATVRITGPDTREETSDSSGLARFVGIATGTYRIDVTHASYKKTTTANVQVNQGSNSMKWASLK